MHSKLNSQRCESIPHLYNTTVEVGNISDSRHDLGNRDLSFDNKILQLVCWQLMHVLAHPTCEFKAPTCRFCKYWEVIKERTNKICKYLVIYSWSPRQSLHVWSLNVLHVYRLPCARRSLWYEPRSIAVSEKWLRMKPLAKQMYPMQPSNEQQL